jgi:hypothetical protein
MPLVTHLQLAAVLLIVGERWREEEGVRGGEGGCLGAQ